MTSPQTPRSPDELHVEVGAYVLGVLDPVDRMEFEEHLADCAACQAEIEQLSGLEPMLAELAGAGLPSGGPGITPKPSPQLLDRLVTDVSASRRRSRTRRLVLVAAAAALIVGGPAATLAVTADSKPQPVAVAQQQFSATDASTGTSATVGVAAKKWGSQVSLSLTLPALQGPINCDLVAVSRQGDRQTVTTWSVPAAGYSTLQTTGGAGLSPTDIDHFEVRTLDTANRLLVSVPVAQAPA